MRESSRRDLGEQAAHVAEVMLRRRVRYPGPACAFAQRESLQSAIGEYGFAGGDQGFLQIAVMVGLLRRAGRRAAVVAIGRMVVASRRLRPEFRHHRPSFRGSAHSTVKDLDNGNM